VKLEIEKLSAPQGAHRFRRVAAFLLVTMLLVPAARGDSESRVTFGETGNHWRARLTGYLVNPNIREASGITASCNRPDVFWTLNDSGNTADIYAVGINGEDLGTFRVKGAGNRDWEDMASFWRNGTAFLLIADTGDNRDSHKNCRIYIAAEPMVTGRPRNGTVSVHQTIRFTYEDGPRDCEAVGVDITGNRILLITKNRFPARLYEIPLPKTTTTTVVARRIGELTGIPQPTTAELKADSKYGRYRALPTALDFTSTSDAAVVLTYGEAYLYVKSGSENWETAFSKTPKPLAAPRLLQAESACFGKNDIAVFITSERFPAPLWRIGPELRSEETGIPENHE
jgi:hypothetical protein